MPTNRGPKIPKDEPQIVGFIDLKKVVQVRQTPAWNDVARKIFMAKKPSPFVRGAR